MIRKLEAELEKDPVRREKLSGDIRRKQLALKAAVKQDRRVHKKIFHH